MILTKNNLVTLGRSAVVLVVVASINALVSFGFSLSYLIATPHDVTAGYALVRAVVLAVILAVSASRRSVTAIIVSAIGLTLMQAGDTIVGAFAGSPQTTFGPLVLAVATLICLIVFVRAVRLAPTLDQNASKE